MDARGNVTEELIGGMASSRSFEADTGRIQSINTWYGLLQDLSFTFDELGNLIERTDDTGSHSYTETFTYDDLNRLWYTTSGAATNLTLTYDAAGNIKTKSNMQGGATYNYGSHPHAVASVGGVSYGYDPNGNMTSGDGRTITYTTFDEPSSVTKGGYTTAFKYGPNRARFQRTDTTGGQTTTTLYIGNVERIEQPGGVVLTKRYLGPVIVTTASNDPTPVELLVLTDHLGSIYALVNRSGYSLAQGMSFDAWGLRRDTDWSDFTSTELTTFFGGNTRRGYTGHEAMDETGLIHMNGRAYDPKLGRFVSADPLVQVATNTQSYNRYSYVFNNPLSYTDPTGFSAWTDFRDNIMRPALSIAAAIVLSPHGAWALGQGMWAAAGAGFISGAIATGDLRGAVVGAFSGALFNAIGSHFEQQIATNQANADIAALFSGMDPDVAWSYSSSVGLTAGQTASKILAHGLAGGVMGVLSGGKFGHGFAAAGMTQMAFQAGVVSGTRAASTIKAALVGGSVSALTGGKFGNGAMTGAFSVLFNEGGHAQQGDVLRSIHSAVDSMFGRPFGSQDAAANYLHDSLYSLSVEYGVEIGARIYKYDGQYWISEPYTDFKPDEVASRPVPDLIPGGVAGNWHSHPAWNSKPSDIDYSNIFRPDRQFRASYVSLRVNGIPVLLRADGLNTTWRPVQ